MDASRLGTDPLTRYAPAHRELIRVQARNLARLMASAIPPTERGGRSGARWEDAFYEGPPEQCAPSGAKPKLRVDPAKD